MITTTAVFGNTGLVGAEILSTLLALDACKTVYTISRRQPKAESPKLNVTIEPDSTKWTSILSSLSPFPSIVFSAVGTTRLQAGGIQNQWKIDHDLNVEIAKSARASGAKTFVFVSSAGTRGLLANHMPYSQMKQGVEDKIKELDFEQAIILRPGLLLGHREVSRTGEGAAIALARCIGRLSQAAQDMFAQEADVIARAAVSATRIAAEGKAPNKYWVLEAADIIRLGRTEWKA
ncbi:NAD(P)-binding protein [Camillea tinctor]|nr:NAD(P)-binding protein [Camillea tinctor]